MATLTFTATGLTARSKTISAGDVTRVLNAYKSITGQVPDVAPGTLRDRTNQEVFDWFVDNRVLSRILEDVRNVEGDAANKAVLPIVLT